ncbi:chemotaxis protein CheD [Pseudoprimorskyibacter insulae]|uniref:Probable chemoreceptor glutamine deamidase CheD n=1 Tax=Pseudoprimorskyibacter insulae TaxID=1695997 RepID=A0A2R8B127_9RHOB|nr:chemotaxis protein CheD [Pseudoprimorskyibacter insulae]SPF81947.1 Chemoreceptor glutamine deamidase CheD [Pseudoprimorskyibacter insulae]
MTNLAETGRVSSGRSINVIQGDFKISRSDGDVLTTVLGSCVAMCLYDLGAGIGGMNHFLLPERKDTCHSDIRFGAHAMELLINALLRCGADRSRLKAKLFGGATMSTNLSDIGKANAEFAVNFLATENIACVSTSLGGTTARRIRFWPTSGRVQQLQIPNSPELVARRTNITNQPQPDVTLF